MGFKSAWGSLWSGNYRDSFNYLLTDEDAIETQQLIQNDQEAKIAQDYNKGLIDTQEAGELMNKSAGSAYPFLWQNEPGGDPARVFAESVEKDTAKLFSTAIGSPLKLVPWWVWIVIGLGAIVYFWPAIRIALAFREKIRG